MPGDGKLIKRLLANDKPGVNVTDPDTGMTALMLAASAGHDDVVFLLTKGMQAQDIRHQTPQGDTALGLADAAGMPMWCGCRSGKARNRHRRTKRWPIRSSQRQRRR